MSYIISTEEKIKMASVLLYKSVPKKILFGYVFICAMGILRM